MEKRGGKNLYKILKAFAKHDAIGDLEVIKTDCTDRCKFAPVCSIQPGNIWLKEYSEHEVRQLFKSLDQDPKFV